MRRLDDAAFAWTESSPLKGHAARRHMLLALLAAAPILAWDLSVGAPGDAWNASIGLLFLAPALAWRGHNTYRVVTGLLAAATTLLVTIGAIYGVGLLFVPVMIGTWLAFARPPTRW
jgi:hypothetical protein